MLFCRLAFKGDQTNLSRIFSCQWVLLCKISFWYVFVTDTCNPMSCKKSFGVHQTISESQKSYIHCKSKKNIDTVKQMIQILFKRIQHIKLRSVLFYRNIHLNTRATNLKSKHILQKQKPDKQKFRSLGYKQSCNSKTGPRFEVCDCLLSEWAWK